MKKKAGEEIFRDISGLEEPPLYKEIIRELTIRDYLFLEFCLIVGFYTLLKVQSIIKLAIISYKFTQFTESIFASLKYAGVATKRAEAKRFVSLILMAFIVYFLFLSVLPGNERTFVCAADDNSCTAMQGDTSSATCTAYGTCNGGPGWNLATSGDCTGDASCASTTCCGDDTGEAKKTESSDSTAPSVFNNGVFACCNVATDCNYDGTCYATTAATGTIPNRAYCSSGTWQGGDNSSTACTGVIGSSGY